MLLKLTSVLAIAIAGLLPGTTHGQHLVFRNTSAVTTGPLLQPVHVSYGSQDHSLIFGSTVNDRSGLLVGKTVLAGGEGPVDALRAPTGWTLTGKEGLTFDGRSNTTVATLLLNATSTSSQPAVANQPDSDILVTNAVRLLAASQADHVPSLFVLSQVKAAFFANVANPFANLTADGQWESTMFLSQVGANNGSLLSTVPLPFYMAGNVLPEGTLPVAWNNVSKVLVVAVPYPDGNTTITLLSADGVISTDELFTVSGKQIAAVAVTADEGILLAGTTNPFLNDSLSCGPQVQECSACVLSKFTSTGLRLWRTIWTSQDMNSTCTVDSLAYNPTTGRVLLAKTNHNLVTNTTTHSIRQFSERSGVELTPSLHFPGSSVGASQGGGSIGGLGGLASSPFGYRNRLFVRWNATLLAGLTTQSSLFGYTTGATTFQPKVFTVVFDPQWTVLNATFVDATVSVTAAVGQVGWGEDGAKGRVVQYLPMDVVKDGAMAAGLAVRSVKDPALGPENMWETMTTTIPPMPSALPTVLPGSQTGESNTNTTTTNILMYVAIGGASGLVAGALLGLLMPGRRSSGMKPSATGKDAQGQDDDDLELQAPYLHESMGWNAAVAGQQRDAAMSTMAGYVGGNSQLAAAVYGVRPLSSGGIQSYAETMPAGLAYADASSLYGATMPMVGGTFGGGGGGISGLNTVAYMNAAYGNATTLGMLPSPAVSNPSNTMTRNTTSYTNMTEHQPNASGNANGITSGQTQMVTGAAAAAGATSYTNMSDHHPNVINTAYRGSAITANGAIIPNGPPQDGPPLADQSTNGTLRHNNILASDTSSLLNRSYGQLPNEVPTMPRDIHSTQWNQVPALPINMTTVAAGYPSVGNSSNANAAMPTLTRQHQTFLSMAADPAFANFHNNNGNNNNGNASSDMDASMLGMTTVQQQQQQYAASTLTRMRGDSPPKSPLKQQEQQSQQKAADEDDY